MESHKVKSDTITGQASVVGNKAIKEKRGKVKIVQPDSFEPERHFYPRVLNAQVHPMVGNFFSLGNKRMVARYCHMHPAVDPAKLTDLLTYRPKYFRWAGCDTFNVVSHNGRRQVVVIETNSCPSGQKSMPLLRDTDEEGGYRRLLETTFSELLDEASNENSVKGGVLAVVYDKNPMEASGYAAVMAELTGEKVYLVEYYLTDPDPPVRWVENDEVMTIRTSDGEWKPVRAAFRYVTQRPWTRFPVVSRTRVLNPILPCLAGGRNKLVAAKAYDMFNGELEACGSGLRINTPETVHDVKKSEVPLWVRSFGGHAVIKVPYSNAGQGVYTILSKQELDQFIAENHHYDKFIIQSLVGNSKWSSTQKEGCFFHVGTVPNKRNEIYVADVRMMIASTNKGFQPMAVYARRAHEPLVDKINEGTFSWGMLGTNLSKMTDDLTWTTESERLLLMDRKDFNTLGIGIDDLIEAYVQTTLSAVAIDKMCCRLMRRCEPNSDKYEFDRELFASLNDDPALLEELF